MKNKNGGPAFPRSGFESAQSGMTLHDWFAGQALMGLVMLDQWQKSRFDIARQAHLMADEMIAAKEHD